MSKKHRYNQHREERQESISQAPAPIARGPRPMAVGLGIAIVVGLIGWGILHQMDAKPPRVVPSDSKGSDLQVVPSTGQDSPSTQSGSALQNAPNQSLDGSPSSDLQPTGGSTAQSQTSTELFNQTEHGDTQIKVTP